MSVTLGEYAQSNLILNTTLLFPVVCCSFLLWVERYLSGRLNSSPNPQILWKQTYLEIGRWQMQSVYDEVMLSYTGPKILMPATFMRGEKSVNEHKRVHVTTMA